LELLKYTGQIALLRYSEIVKCSAIERAVQPDKNIAAQAYPS
jgi:hypothetical protein